MKIAALGRTQFLYDALLALRDAGHSIVVIGTCPAAPEYTRTEDDFARLAQAIGCPHFCDARLLDAPLTQAHADIAVSVNWPTLIPPRFFALFPHGILNFHMGDLPRYRGNACPNWAILNRETEVVLTVHQMARELDAGPVITQGRVPLTDATYIGDVYRTALEAVPGLFVEAVAGLESGSLQPRPQSDDPALSLRCFPRIPSDGWIDWLRPAEQLARLVRASAEPFAGAFTWYDDRRLTIWRARADRLPYPWCGVPGQVAEVDRQSGEVAILTGTGVLRLQEVSIDSDNRQRACDVLKSTRIRLGSDPAAQLLRLQERIQRLETSVIGTAPLMD